MRYKIIFPADYVQVPLPGRDEWTKELRSGKYEQGKGLLCLREKYCCLGILSSVQGRLTESGGSGYRGDGGFSAIGCLASGSNPLYEIFGAEGNFPNGVFVRFDNSDKESLANCNDRGLTFKQIANIIDKVWSNAPKNW